jgi:ribonuclease T1
MAVVAVALLAAFAWTTLRTSKDTTPQPPVASTSTPGTRATQPLEMPPPLTDNPRTSTAQYPDFLPREAIETMQRIERGGPYPHRQDDGVFGNRESKLPQQSRGYYREYTVETPGSRDRGARRIIVGGRPPSEFFYTDDHYRSFRRFTLDGSPSDNRGRSR